MVGEKEEWNLYDDISQNKLLGTEETQWITLEGIYCKVYYQKNPQEAQMILHMADTYYPWIAKDFDWNRADKLEFVLFHNEDAMKKALNIHGDRQVPMGAYYKGAASILSPSIWVQNGESWKQTEEFLENGPVVHEMIHFAIDEKAKGEYPHWFSEGVALYYEKKYTGYEWRTDLKDEAQVITMEQLYHEFETLDPSVSYRKSFDWVNGYVRKFGEEKLQELLASGKLNRFY